VSTTPRARSPLLPLPLPLLRRLDFTCTRDTSRNSVPRLLTRLLTGITLITGPSPPWRSLNSSAPMPVAFRPTSDVSFSAPSDCRLSKRSRSRHYRYGAADFRDFHVRASARLELFLTIRAPPSVRNYMQAAARPASIILRRMWENSRFRILT